MWWRLEEECLEDWIYQDLSPDLGKIFSAHQGLCDKCYSPSSNAVSAEHNPGGVHPIGMQRLQEVNGGIQTIMCRRRMMVVRKLSVPTEGRWGTAHQCVQETLKTFWITSSTHPRVTWPQQWKSVIHIFPYVSLKKLPKVSYLNSLFKPMSWLDIVDTSHKLEPIGFEDRMRAREMPNI